jgi:hypothetical protein
MRHNPYDDVKVIGGTSVAPQSFTGSTPATGSKVDTIGADNAAVYGYGAAASGTPTTGTVTVKIQESADGSTSWSDALDNTSTVISFVLDCHAAAADNVARIEGLNLNRKRYLRAVVTPAFTGGSSPAIIAFAQIILGNASPLPVDTSVSNT